MAQPANKFIKPFLKDNDFTIIANAGFRKLSDGRRVRITLTDFGHKDRFTALLVEIVCKKGGVITKQSFNFDDMMDIEPNNPNPNATNEKLHVWKDMTWYINTPTKSSVKRYLQEIENYIEMFE